MRSNDLRIERESTPRISICIDKSILHIQVIPIKIDYPEQHPSILIVSLFQLSDQGQKDLPSDRFSDLDISDITRREIEKEQMRSGGCSRSILRVRIPPLLSISYSTRIASTRQPKTPQLGELYLGRQGKKWKERARRGRVGREGKGEGKKGKERARKVGEGRVKQEWQTINPTCRNIGSPSEIDMITLNSDPINISGWRSIHDRLYSRDILR